MPTKFCISSPTKNFHCLDSSLLQIASHSLIRYQTEIDMAMRLNVIIVTVQCLLLTETTQSLSSMTYCVKSSSTCNQKLACLECQSLEWLVWNSASIQNDSTILFLPGNHHLISESIDTDVIVRFLYKDRLSLIGISNSSVSNGTGGASHVICTPGKAIGSHFDESTNILIHALIFKGCRFFMQSQGYLITLSFLENIKCYDFTCHSFGQCRI